MEFTVIYDNEGAYSGQYAIYYHPWKVGRNGYYTKRKYLVYRVWSMQMCLAWIMDILNNPDCLANSISAKQIIGG